jgi:Carboxypeptidase regulatory-like domain/PDZ domain
VRPFLAKLWALFTAILLVITAGTLPGTRLLDASDQDLAPALQPAKPRNPADLSTLSVLVTHAGAPIAGAKVRVFEKDGTRIQQTLTASTATSGIAVFEQVPHGTFCIVADHEGMARAASWIALIEKERALTLDAADEQTIDVDVRTEEGAAAVHAEVEVLTDSPVPTGVRVGPDGHVHVRGLAGKRFTVKARAPGFDEVIKRGVLPGDHVTVVLPQLASVSIVVMDPEAKTGGRSPSAGAMVQIASTELWPPRMTVTNAEGKATIKGLRPGMYAFRASKVEMVAPAELGILLERGKESQLRLELSQGVMLNVKVVEAGNEASAIRGAKVVAVERGLSSFPIEVVTDGKGISLSASHALFVPKGPIPVPVPMPNNVQIALEEAAVVEGRIVDGRGFPVDGAHLRIVGFDFSGGPFEEDPELIAFRARPAPTDTQRLLPIGELGVMPGPLPMPPAMLSPLDAELAAAGPANVNANANGPKATEKRLPWISNGDGTFKLAPVSPGRLRVLVKHPEFIEALSESITVKPGETGRINIVLHKGGVLEGVILDTKGRPAAGYEVVLAETAGERSVRSGSDGSFAFAAVPGEVVVSVRGQEDAMSILTRANVSIPDGGKTKLKLTIPEVRESITARVEDDRGYPLEFAQISATSLQANTPVRTTGFTDKRGEAILSNVKGLKLRLEVRASGHAAKVLLIAKAEGTVRIGLVRGERVEGEVTSARGAAVASAEVTLETESGIRRVFSSADGSFAIDSVEAGSYTLNARAPGFSLKRQKITIVDRNARSVTRLPRIELETEAIVEGTVVDERGSPIAGARVGASAVSSYVLTGAPLRGEAVADARGQFRLGELAAGSVTLHVYAPDLGRGISAPIEVASGQTKSGIRITLTKAADKFTDLGPAPTVAITLGETSEPREVVIVSVTAGSGAERAGLRAGDVVLAIEGVKVTRIDEARKHLTGPLSDDVLIEVRRAERELTVRAARDAARR